MTKTIEILVAPTGATTVQTKGFSGASCRQASRFLEEVLGKKTSERLTGEFHQAVECNQQQQQRTE